MSVVIISKYQRLFITSLCLSNVNKAEVGVHLVKGKFQIVLYKRFLRSEKFIVKFLSKIE